MVRRWTYPFLALLFLLLTACGQGPEETPSPGADQGPGEPDVAIQILNPQDVPQEAQDFVQSHQEETGIFQEVIGTSTYILVSWGSKPSSAYQLMVERAEPSPDGLAIDVSLKEPSSDDVTLPVVSYPLALLQVTPAAYYSVDVSFSGGIFYENNSFKLEKPVPYEKVADAVHIKGQARVWEATFHVRVEDGHVVLLDQVLTAPEGAPAWSSFDVSLPLQMTPTSPYGTLFVFYYSPKDGEPTDQLMIPLQFTHWSHP
ncbi:MAG: Gmad2 immunoglobulin-like domain-containing protein [Bacillota bacterium]|nr:Gmad2 immunoglobulin-like domain-containing protein [Bacillota bacterium]